MIALGFAANRLPQPQPDSERQILTLGLYGIIIEDLSACLLLALFSETHAIPIILPAHGSLAESEQLPIGAS